MFWLFCVFLAVFSADFASAQEEDALLEYRNGNFSGAVAICQKEIKSNAGNVESYIVLCWSLLRLGRYNEAALYASKVFDLSRYDVRVIEIMGEVNYYQGNNAAALKYFQEYVNLAPEGQRIDVVYYFMGEIYIRLARYHYADIAISTALHYDSKNARWWMRLAYAREMSGETQEAVRAYKNALELDSNLPDAQRGLTRALSALSGGA